MNDTIDTAPNVSVDLLLVEDNAIQASAVQRALGSASFQIHVTAVTTLARALHEATIRTFDVVVLDLGLPDSDGISTFRAIKNAVAPSAIVVLSGLEDEQLAATAVREGAQDYLLKSQLSPSLLVRAVTYALHRHAANIQLQWSRARFRAVFDHAVDAILVFDEEGCLTDANAAFGELMGGVSIERFAGLRFTEIFGTENATTRVWRDFLEAGCITGEMSFHTACRRRRTVEYSATAYVGSAMHVWTFHDITERRALETELFRSRQMDALGRLAAGVAHDFNNILMAVSSYGELLRDKLSDDPSLSKYVSQILRASQRATGLTNQMLAFCRQDRSSPEVVDVNLEAADSLKMISRLLGEDIDVRFLPIGEQCAVRASAGAIGQIMLNVCINARDAMPKGGTLTVSTAKISADAAFCSDHPTIAPGQYVCLNIDDTGVGIEPDVRDRIFEPFFTTKGTSHGTGLGLATVYGIVTSMKGLVVVESTVGQGSTFAFYFPAEADQVVARELSSRAPVSDRQQGTILLVEDEAAIRTALQEELMNIGYDVISAASGDEAVELATRRAARVDVILTDVIMPKMNGRELVDAITAVHPNATVIFMSGYSGDVLQRNGVESDAQVLRKPFSLAALQSRIAQCERVCGH